MLLLQRNQTDVRCFVCENYRLVHILISSLATDTYTHAQLDSNAQSQLVAKASLRLQSAEGCEQQRKRQTASGVRIWSIATHAQRKLVAGCLPIE